jgi:hypothetical protein
VRELRGWLFATIGFLLFSLLHVDTISDEFPDAVSSFILWVAWIIVAVGALDAMQIINVLSLLEKVFHKFSKKSGGK